MPFIRLSDNYIDNPKITALSDGAFRLWHQMLAYCRRHLTDGLIPKATMLDFSCYRTKRLTELLTPYRPEARALVVIVPGFGFLLTNYLDWNLPKYEELRRSEESKKRAREWRSNKVRAPHELDMDMDTGASTERGFGRKPKHWTCPHTPPCHKSAWECHRNYQLELVKAGKAQAS